MSSNKVIVTIAPTGGVAKKTQNPNLPTQPEEIAADVVRCHKAGAAIAAIHARRPDDQATCDDRIYRRINELVRAKCDIILNNSTGGGNDGDMTLTRPDGLFEVNFAERLNGLEGGAEMATFDGMTFVDVLDVPREVLVITPPSRCDQLIERMRERAIKPEWEVFAPQHILQDAIRLIEKGYDAPPYYFNIVLGAHRGFQGAMPYSHETLMAMVRMLPPQSIWSVSAIGAAQIEATTLAILLGGHVRVGLEDNLYYSRGVPATNEALVQRQIRILSELGREPASPAETRALLGLTRS